MLRKLLKYEIKATARLFLPLYAAVLLFAFINRYINPFKRIGETSSLSIQTMISSISTIAYFALVIGVIVMTLVIMIQRFYKNLLGDEGYLMFTLPVNTWKHIASKLLVSMLWIILSLITVIGSVLIILNVDGVYSAISQALSIFKAFFGYSGFVVMPMYALIATVSNITMVYTAITLGHLFSKHKLLMSFAMYAILYMTYQVVLTIFLLAFKNTIFAAIISSTAPTGSQINTFILSLAVISIVLIAGHFILTNNILKNKLNLE